MFKHSGIVRRVDDVGRLVIPKEVRQRFRIKEGDPIEIGEDGDFIALRKYSPIEITGDTVQMILNCFSKVTSHPVILCSTTHVLCSVRITMKAPEYLTAELSDALIDADKSYLGYEITTDSKLKVRILEKIRIGSDVEGALIIPKTDSTAIITDADKTCLKLCAKMISEFLT